jgi:hypothetical protein
VYSTKGFKVKEHYIFEVIINAIPQWYEGKIDGSVCTININGIDFYIGSHKRLTPQLGRLYDYICDNINNWLEKYPDILSSSNRKEITQELTVYWLNGKNSCIDWYKFISYSEELLFRTYENIPVTTNLIIYPGNSGGQDITDPRIQKVIDPLATSMQTYLAVDENANFISYEQIDWAEISDTVGYKFSPEFLQPFTSKLQEREYSFHVTTKGDVIILDMRGLLAAYRKGRWYIYDSATLKNSIVSIAGDYTVGCNIFEMLLDLSYKRHGALLIYDPSHAVLNKVVNTESIVDNSKSSDIVRMMLAPSVSCLGIGNNRSSDRKKRILLELASMDGAVIFDNSKILSFGSMIATHPKTGSYIGARTTAFESAFLHGGKPFKVSSDGDISLRFGSDTNIINFL